MNQIGLMKKTFKNLWKDHMVKETKSIKQMSISFDDIRDQNNINLLNCL